LTLSYKILQKIGAGGIEEVYLAKDLNLYRQVAFELLPGVSAGDPDRLARFQREAQRWPRHRVRTLPH
jgi:serine/threonine protein kinase